MRNNNVENEDFNSFNLILFLYRWRKLLIIFTLAAAILSFIFTLPFFITPKFRSSVILFPTSSNSVSKALLSENADSKQDILEFGYEEQTEQMLQMLNSNKIRDRIIKKFDLMKHYDIDPNSSYKNTKLNREYDKNITFRRTEFMAVEIAVLDKDPQMAA
ncbi:MAG TPA: Wzz/FepE/Etk N-terminal domain-containing protein, partial [Bacteroidales bacterium]|nr:Wzz/FepE/Etk N-terminal domain-containing protein [Bacteroidales bacterium]